MKIFKQILHKKDDGDLVILSDNKSLMVYCKECGYKTMLGLSNGIKLTFDIKDYKDFKLYQKVKEKKENEKS